MHSCRHAGRLLLVGAAGLASAATLTGPVAAAAASHAAPGRIAAPGSAVATCPGWTALRPPNPGTSTDDLFGVAVLSSSNAWAVGDDSNGAADVQISLGIHHGDAGAVIAAVFEAFEALDEHRLSDLSSDVSNDSAHV